MHTPASRDSGFGWTAVTVWLKMSEQWPLGVFLFYVFICILLLFFSFLYWDSNWEPGSCQAFMVPLSYIPGPLCLYFSCASVVIYRLLGKILMQTFLQQKRVCRNNKVQSSMFSWGESEMCVIYCAFFLLLGENQVAWQTSAPGSLRPLCYLGNIKETILIVFQHYCILYPGKRLSFNLKKK